MKASNKALRPIATTHLRSRSNGQSPLSYLHKHPDNSLTPNFTFQGILSLNNPPELRANNSKYKNIISNYSKLNKGRTINLTAISK